MPKEKSCESKWESLSGGIVFVCSYLLPLASCKLTSIRWRVGASGKDQRPLPWGQSSACSPPSPFGSCASGHVPDALFLIGWESAETPTNVAADVVGHDEGYSKTPGAGRSARATPVRGGELLCARRNVPPLRCMGSLVWECGDPWGQPLLLHAIAETVSRLVFLRLGPAARSSSEHAVRGVDVHPELG